ncbi:MAG: nucleotidyl transferase AbiEii/AbiGii toxin family protein [Solirubrobacterales bacterium]
MANLDRQQIIELFHVAFLDALSHKLPQTRYVLKGGANLRYFFGSPRYSEDIDLDASDVETWQLEEKVDDVLDSPQLKIVLRPSGLAVAEISKPKQTEATQRWKVGISAPGEARLVRTKIEFSRRNGEERYRLEAIPNEIVRPYGLRPPTIQHYIDGVPTEQKILALAGRTQTQARDVFDLDLLLRRQPLPSGQLDPDKLAEAARRALGLSFEEFRQQVVEFLEPDAFVLYDSTEAWDLMQTAVADQLEAAR